MHYSSQQPCSFTAEETEVQRTGATCPARQRELGLATPRLGPTLSRILGYECQVRVHTAEMPPEFTDSTLIPSRLLFLWSKERPPVLEVALILPGVSTWPSRQAWAGQAHADTALLAPHPEAQEPRPGATCIQNSP